MSRAPIFKLTHYRIVYPSVQASHSGLPDPIPRFTFLHRRHKDFNVVLFHKAARVQRLNQGAAISVSGNSYLYSSDDDLDNGPEVKYTVWVAGAEDRPQSEDISEDDSTLKFSSLDVHYVKAVKFETLPSPIFRLPAESKVGYKQNDASDANLKAS